MCTCEIIPHYSKTIPVAVSHQLVLNFSCMRMYFLVLLRNLIGVIPRNEILKTLHYRVVISRLQDNDQQYFWPCHHVVIDSIEGNSYCNYASVRMRRRHTVVGACICVCICMSATRVSRRPLQTRHWRVQCRHNATISQT